jgi:ComF family protein
MLSRYLNDLTHLFFPHNCEGCGSDVMYTGHFLCSRCIHRLPETGFLAAAGNPVEKTFYGRIPVIQAGAAFYFTKRSLLQHVMMQLKYHDNREAGYFLGRMLGNALLQSGRFGEVDIMVPLPLNPKKEFIRGYNQAVLICEGIREIWNRPVAANAVIRGRFTETQTLQNRIGRWQNMEGVFEVAETTLLHNRHVLLVDDVITTGATLEACGSAILEIPGTRLSIASVAYTV